MKNIHILPTDKPSRLHLGYRDLVLCELKYGSPTINGQHLYITNDEEAKEGDWGYIQFQGGDVKLVGKYFADDWKKIILTTDQDLINDGVQEIADEFLEWFVKNPSCELVEVVKEMYIPQSNGKMSDGKITHELSLDPSQNTLPYYKIIIPKEEQKQHLIDIMRGDEELGLYEEPKQETLKEVTLAILFHNTYEKLAPSFGYETRLDTKSFETTTPNGMLMIAVCKEIIKWQQERMYSEEEVIAIVEKSRETGLTAEFLLLTEQFKNKK